MLCDWHWLHWRPKGGPLGGDGEPMEKEGEDVPVIVPAYGRWVLLAGQMGGKRGRVYDGVALHDEFDSIR